MLDGAVEPVRRSFQAGTPSIFAGHYTLHRVISVRGRRHRAGRGAVIQPGTRSRPQQRIPQAVLGACGLNRR